MTHFDFKQHLLAKSREIYQPIGIATRFTAKYSIKITLVVTYYHLLTFSY